MATQGGLQSATLRNPAPNFFRFFTDASQWPAGLGSYAYHDLGWRRAAVVDGNWGLLFGEAAGFIAEFCSLGGQIVHRTSMPVFGPPIYDEQIAAFPTSGIDGVFLASHFAPLEALMETHPFFADNVADRVIGGSITFDAEVTKYEELIDQLEGVAYAEPGHDAEPSGEALERFVADFDAAFPDHAGNAPFNPTMGYYNNMEAALRASSSSTAT